MPPPCQPLRILFASWKNHRRLTSRHNSHRNSRPLKWPLRRGRRNRPPLLSLPLSLRLLQMLAPTRRRRLIRNLSLALILRPCMNRPQSFQHQRHRLNPGLCWHQPLLKMQMLFILYRAICGRW